ncbi:MAG: Uma2 family endonuclease [Chloroflexota bacterium]|nr:Uma2 family endonuclease [Chloroflexota bacterium]
MRMKTEATIEDLYNVPENGNAELVDGEVVVMAASGPEHGRAAMKIAFSLYEYELKVGWGHVAPDNVGFIVHLPHRGSFSPDAAYYVGPAGGLDFVEGAPLFAVEVRSKNDYGAVAGRAMAAKRADYFAAGTQVVWDVDLLSPEVVRVYRIDRPEEPMVYVRGEMAEAEPALPGWQMGVDQLFM